MFALQHLLAMFVIDFLSVVGTNGLSEMSASLSAFVIPALWARMSLRQPVFLLPGHRHSVVAAHGLVVADHYFPATFRSASMILSYQHRPASFQISRMYRANPKETNSFAFQI